MASIKFGLLFCDDYSYCTINIPQHRIPTILEEEISLRPSSVILADVIISSYPNVLRGNTLPKKLVVSPKDHTHG